MRKYTWKRSESSHLSPFPPNHTRGLAARRIFRVLPPYKGAIHFQTPLPSLRFKPRPYDKAPKQERTRVDDLMSIRIINKVNTIATYTDIHFQWIPSHVNVPENEIVDFLAKRGFSEIETIDYALTYQEIYTLMKIKDKEMKKLFQIEVALNSSQWDSSTPYVINKKTASISSNTSDME
ncbi:hypothetical protein TNCV_1597111 [Trichonephila clavipes]|nr:hypothetical protein TNCV_1597111 [Trichonephila clavipes]